MSEEFKKTGVNTVTSEKGFTVEVKFAGGVLYRDSNGEVKIDSEWLAKPPGILLYKNKKRFDKMQQSLFDDMFSNVAKALEYLGHRVEIWS
jgi:hypothetical protein